MRAGQLRHLVDVMEDIVEVDDMGAIMDSTNPLNTTPGGLPCSIEFLSGKELEVASMQDADVRFKIRTRWHDIDPQKNYLRNVADGRMFNIVSVNNVDERGRELIMMCSEKLEDE